MSMKLMKVVSDLRGMSLPKQALPFKMVLPSSLKRSTESDPSIPEISISTYELLDLIGEGGFSKVYAGRKCESMSYKYKYAVKVCDLVRTEEEEMEGESQNALGLDDKTRLPTPLESIKEELQVLRLLQKSSYVIKLYDAFQVNEVVDKRKVWVVMERFETSTADVLYLAAQVKKLSLPMRKKHRLVCNISLQTSACIVLEVLKALKSLKRHRVVHCDIKPGNLLLSKYGKVVLCDFGISKVLKDGHDFAFVKYVQGTPAYMASEMVSRGLKFDYSADIWSLGVVLYNLFTSGEMPWAAKDPERQRFLPYMWERWAHSNEMYFSKLLRSSFITGEEYRRLRVSTGKTRSEGGEEWRDAAYSHVEPIAQVVRRAMIPQPKHGKNGEVTREGLLDRLTLDEFTEWCEGVIGTIPEFKRRMRIKRMVKVITAAKPVLAEIAGGKQQELLTTL